MNVEAYVVKGMSTPFILGNDFALQYSISVIREDMNMKIQLGNSGRSVEADDTDFSSPLDDDGHAFKVTIGMTPHSSIPRNRLHRKNQKIKKRLRRGKMNAEVRSVRRIVIPPEVSKAVPVKAFFPRNANTLFVERQVDSSGNADNIFGSADSFISRQNCFLHVANFSKSPIVISEGQLMGTARNSSTWLDRESSFSNEQLSQIRAHSNLIKTLAESGLDEITSESQGSLTVISSTEISSKAQRNATEPDDPASTEPLEGGPKTSETPTDPIPATQLLAEVNISKDLSATQRQQLEAVILRNQGAFGLDGRLGNFEERIDIPLKPGAVPVSLPPFPVSPAKREVIDKQMDSWIKLGVIEPSKSPWAAPVFIVYRNSKPRMVIDLQRLNESVIPDEFPIPKQEDILQALTGSQWLTTLDALAGFTQLTMTDSAAEKLAFRTHRGLWQFRRMPFGYRNGPSLFQRIMQNVLAPFLWIFALVYIDDIVVFSLTFDDHLRHLDQVFSAIEKANITLSPGKCHFAYQSLLLLGQKVSRLGLSTHKEKVDAIMALEVPRNVSELHTFLGMMVYFSAYIPFYSWIAHPLFQLLKKDHEWKWTDLHQEAFELSKQVLTSAPVRRYAMEGLPYRLYTDACDYGLAGILQQVQPIAIRDLKGTRVYEQLERAFKNKESVPALVPVLSKDSNDVPPPGPWASNFDDTIVYVERVMSYWSRVLKSAERNYSPTECEALALKEALIKFQPFLEGGKTLAITDHAALTWSKTFQNMNRRLLTWGTVFSAYPDLKIIHRAGRVHSNVDPISRLRRRVPFESGPLTDNIKSLTLNNFDDPLKDMYAELGNKFEEKLLNVAAKYVASERDSSLNFNFERKMDPVPIISGTDKIEIPYFTSSSYSVLIGIEDSEIQKWIVGYKSDRHFSEVLRNWKGEKNWTNPLYPQYHYSDNGLIYFEDWEGNNRLCVPQSLRVSVMDEVHNTLTESAHGGYHKCYNRMASIYYWPGMSRELKRYVTSCDICQKSKPRRHAASGLLQPIPIPSRPFEVVTMDFIPELPISGGFDNILVIVDKLTKYGIFIPCSTSISEEETAHLFFKHVISRFGIPRQVITDRDSRWRHDFWQEICQLMGMKRSLTTSYHPQANGQTEILNQSLEIALRAYIAPSRDDWVAHLDGLALSYNSTPHTATTFAPAYLLHGFTPTTASSLIKDGPHISRPDNSDNSNLINEKAEAMVQHFEADRNRAKEALLLSQVHQQRAYNKGRLTNEFEEGDLVVLNAHSLRLLKGEKGRGQKLLMRYDSPFEILRKLSPITYQLRMPASYGIHPIINITHLEAYHKSPPEFRERPTKRLNRSDFEEEPKDDVEAIVGERLRKVGKGRRIREYKTRWEGYGPEFDEWLPAARLKNAPIVLKAWMEAKRTLKNVPDNKRMRGIITGPRN